jgi:hypothetical protein
MGQTMMARGTIKGLVAAAVFAGLAACGGTAVVDQHQSKGPATVSGGLSGTTTVYGMGGYVSGNGSLTFSVNGNSATGGPNIQFVVTFGSGTAITAGTYSMANVSQAVATVSQGSTAFQAMGGAAVPSSDTKGTFTLQVDEVGTTVSGGGSVTWPFVHGSLTATLPGASSGSVSLSATF